MPKRAEADIQSDAIRHLVVGAALWRKLAGTAASFATRLAYAFPGEVPRERLSQHLPVFLQEVNEADSVEPVGEQIEGDEAAETDAEFAANVHDGPGAPAETRQDHGL
jgi:hypothetical protein